MKYEESETVELKSILVPDIEKWIVAFLNSKGGTIYIGVDDKGKVVGVPDYLKDKYDNQLSSMISDEGIKGNARKFVSFGYNDDDVLVISVKEGTNKPYYISGKGPRPNGVYVRYGRSIRQATDEEIYP